MKGLFRGRLSKRRGDAYNRERSKAARQQALAGKDCGPVTTEILDAPEFYFAEGYYQQYPAKNPAGYCGLGGTSVACQIGAAA